MVRYYKYKQSYKKMYPRKRWASNILSNNHVIGIPAGSKAGFGSDVVCVNSNQAVTPTPVLLKFGRIKVKGDVRTDLSNENNFVSAVLYCVYVPQGMTTNPSILTNHPEYILGLVVIPCGT